MNGPGFIGALLMVLLGTICTAMIDIVTYFPSKESAGVSASLFTALFLLM